MKKTLLLISFLTFSIFSCFAVVKTWVGTGGDKLWTNASNWSPSGVPGSPDDVIINISDSIAIVDGLFLFSIYTIKSLKVSNNSNVIMAFNYSGTTGLTRNFLLTSTVTTPYGLEIESGCILSVNSNFTYSGAGMGNMILNLSPTAGGSAGVKCLINGELHFKGYVTNTMGGNGSCGNRLHTFINVGEFAVCIVNGSIIYFPNTGNGTSSLTPNTITMRNGSFYEIRKNGGSFPNCTWEPNSTARVLGMAANGPSFLGSTYGNLEWNSPTQTAVHFFNKTLSFNNFSIINDGSSLLAVNTSAAAATTHTIVINGNLNISSGCLLQLTSSAVPSGSGSQVNLFGNLDNNGTIYSSGNAGTFNNFDFVSGTNQNLSGAGLFSNALVLRMNGNGGVTLLNNISLTNNGIHFLNGKINTGTYILSLPNTTPIISNSSTFYSNLNAAGYSNFGNENSYVVGKLSITGLSAVTKKAFPVGSATTHRPIFLNNTTGNFTVEYSTNNPRTTFNNTMGSGLDHTSSMEYWDITNTGGSAIIEPSFYDPNSGGVTNMTDLRVARFSGTQWDDVSQLPPVPNTTYFGTAGSNGSILSTSQTSFGAFTLASATIQNPLPIKDIKLNFTKTNNLIKLKWTVLGDEDVLSYTTETSNNGMLFTTLQYIFSLNKIGAIQYSYNTLASKQNTYYRIKATLKDNQIVYSNIVRIQPNNLLLTIYPNPVKATIQLNDILEMESYIILNSIGNIVQQQKLTNSTTNHIAINKLPKGVYYLKVMYLNGSVKSCKFIKD